MEERIRQAMSRVLEVRPEEIGEGTSPDTVETWDSHRHMNLVLTLEEEFGVNFTDEQVVEMLSYPLVVVTVKEAMNA